MRRVLGFLSEHVRPSSEAAAIEANLMVHGHASASANEMARLRQEVEEQVRGI